MPGNNGIAIQTADAGNKFLSLLVEGTFTFHNNFQQKFANNTVTLSNVSYVGGTNNLTLKPRHGYVATIGSR